MNVKTHKILKGLFFVQASKQALAKTQSLGRGLTEYLRLYLLLCFSFNLTHCSFPIKYSITNQKRTGTNTNQALHNELRQTPVSAKYINKTTFPSMNLWLEQTSQKVDPKCKGYYLSLTMTSPQALDPQLSLIQSIVTLQVISNTVKKNILFTNQEILTFPSAQSVNEENFLQKAVLRLLDQVMMWCASKQSDELSQ